MKTASKPIVYLLACVSLFISVSLACNLPAKAGEDLSIKPRTEDGSVSGSYRYPGDSGGHKVQFTATKDGFATFRLEGAPEAETLTVLLNDDQTASLSWNGIILDGNGPLEGEEQSALDDLMTGDLAYGISMIPLDAGCLGDDTIDAEQVAALLVPLQMRFKYIVSDREAETRRLMALSNCYAGSGGQNLAEKPSLIMFSASMPVPVVLGYFPLDAQGAVEPPLSMESGFQTACLDSSFSLTDGSLSPISWAGLGQDSYSGLLASQTGPCNAMCRGACGADCAPSNCNLTKELRCEQDEQGQNTGMEIQYLLYDCGLHQGCIDHDNCYDQCNQEYGCGTWQAASCRHGIVTDAAAYLMHPDWWCDQKAIGEHGLVAASLWSRGYGPQPIRETFEYPDDDYVPQLDLDQCPIGDAEALNPGNNETQPVEISPPQEREPDVCSLLPVDASQVINPSKEACVAEFDSLVGCGSCGSTLSITYVESAERAQQGAVDGNCGNPKFSAKGASPIGEAGFTCTNTSGEEYRPGVSQSYFYISFSHGPYAIAISTGYPGQEDLVLSLAQEIVDRIDRQNR